MLSKEAGDVRRRVRVDIDQDLVDEAVPASRTFGHWEAAIRQRDSAEVHPLAVGLGGDESPEVVLAHREGVGQDLRDGYRSLDPST